MLMRFRDEEMERDFRLEFSRQAQPYMRIAILAALTLWLGWIGLDLQNPPDRLPGVLLVRALVGFVIAGIAFVIFMAPERALRFHQAIVLTTVLSFTAGVAATVLLYDYRAIEAFFNVRLGSSDSDFLFIAYASFTVVSAMVVTQLHLRQVAALLFTLGIALITAALYAAIDLSPLLVVVFALSFGAAGVLGLMASFNTERSARAAFDAARIISFERDRSRQLLLNILPESIVRQMPQDGSHASIVEGYDSVSVLFADIAGFTPLLDRISPPALVDMLNNVFSRFDRIARAHGIEKIKTIGDAYMMAAGLPLRQQDHAQAIALCALELTDTARTMKDPEGNPLRFRIGIHAGPAIAGVIGSHKFAYDIWGATVNTAARMEAFGAPGRIQASDTMYELLKDTFEFEYRGVVDIKGKGEMKTWWLVGQRPAA